MEHVARIFVLWPMTSIYSRTLCDEQIWRSDRIQHKIMQVMAIRSQSPFFF